MITSIVAVLAALSGIIRVTGEQGSTDPKEYHFTLGGTGQDASGGDFVIWFEGDGGLHLSASIADSTLTYSPGRGMRFNTVTDPRRLPMASLLPGRQQMEAPSRDGVEAVTDTVLSAPDTKTVTTTIYYQGAPTSRTIRRTESGRLMSVRRVQNISTPTEYRVTIDYVYDARPDSLTLSIAALQQRFPAIVDGAQR